MAVVFEEDAGREGAEDDWRRNGREGEGGSEDGPEDEEVEERGGEDEEEGEVERGAELVLDEGYVWAEEVEAV